MIMLVAAGLFGALLGTVFASRVWATVVALTTAGFVHATVVVAAVAWVDAGGSAADTVFLLQISGAEPIALGSTIASGGLSAMLAGMMTGGAGRRKRRGDDAFRRAAVVGPAGQRVDVLLNR